MKKENECWLTLLSLSSSFSPACGRWQRRRGAGLKASGRTGKKGRLTPPPSIVFPGVLATNVVDMKSRAEAPKTHMNGGGSALRRLWGGPNVPETQNSKLFQEFSVGLRTLASSCDSPWAKRAWAVLASWQWRQWDHEVETAAGRY